MGAPTKKASSKRISKDGNTTMNKFQIRTNLRLRIIHSDHGQDNSLTNEVGAYLESVNEDGEVSERNNGENSELKAFVIFPEGEKQNENNNKRTFICDLNMFNHYKTGSSAL